MALIHEAYLFRPSDFARDISPYAKALTQTPNGEQVLLDALIERFENSSKTSWLASEYGSWDSAYLYEEKAGAERGGRVNVGQLLTFMIYDHLQPVPSQLGLGGDWQLMENVLQHPLGWHLSDSTSLIYGYSFGYFAQLWIAHEPGTPNFTGNRAPMLDHWERAGPGSTAAQIGWLDYPDVRRFLNKLTGDESKLLDVTTSDDQTSLLRVHQNTLQMLRSASEAICGLCIIISG